MNQINSIKFCFIKSLRVNVGNIPEWSSVGWKVLKSVEKKRAGEERMAGRGVMDESDQQRRRREREREREKRGECIEGYGIQSKFDKSTFLLLSQWQFHHYHLIASTFIHFIVIFIHI